MRTVLIAIVFGALLTAASCSKTPKDLHYKSYDADLNGYGAHRLNRFPITIVHVPDAGFGALGLVPVVGRVFTPADSGGNPPVAIMRAEVARNLIQGLSQLSLPAPQPGEFVGMPVQINGSTFTLVGVVGKSASGGFQGDLSPDSDVIYLPASTPRVPSTEK